MNIYEYSRCERCEKSYKGKFKLDREGRVYCYDCDNPEVFSDIKYEEVDMVEDRIVSEIVKDLLKKDLERIYIPLSVEEKENMDFLRDESGNLDAEKVYFKGNPMELVMLAHKKAYKCLEYLETGNKEHQEEAESIVEKYLQMREDYFKKEKQDQFYDELHSKEAKEIEKEVGMV